VTVKCVLVDSGCVDNGTAADDGDRVDTMVVVVVSVVVVDITECATVVTETFNQSIKVYKYKNRIKHDELKYGRVLQLVIVIEILFNSCV
jgi:hypothetical protein